MTDNPATPDVDLDPPGDPDALDTGDLLEVPVEQRTDVDDDPANVDAGVDLTGVDEGTVVAIADDPDDSDPDGDPDADEPDGDPGPPAEHTEGDPVRAAPDREAEGE